MNGSFPGKFGKGRNGKLQIEHSFLCKLNFNLIHCGFMESENTFGGGSGY